MTFFLACAYSLDESPPTLSESLSEEEASLDKVFHDWILKYGKTYSSTTEMNKRREIFKKNLEYIKVFNSDGKKSYRLAINKFADLAKEDMSSCEIEDGEIVKDRDLLC
ncbi:actinidain-like [Trifolium pratense]|uniref:actinidain-like n=1 Tax=Trifolium pratense TaxID=57577 RepID=UPI001E69290F|nr:actinidain-like [Trifolium pratense]